MRQLPGDFTLDQSVHVFKEDRNMSELHSDFQTTFEMLDYFLNGASMSLRWYSCVCTNALPPFIERLHVPGLALGREDREIKRTQAMVMGHKSSNRGKERS